MNTCVKNPKIPIETEITVNFHFSHCKSMENICCQSNHYSYLTGKNTIWVEAYVINMYSKYQLHRKLNFLSPRQLIKFSDLDKINIKRRGLLN